MGSSHGETVSGETVNETVSYKTYRSKNATLEFTYVPLNILSFLSQVAPRFYSHKIEYSVFSPPNHTIFFFKKSIKESFITNSGTQKYIGLIYTFHILTCLPSFAFDHQNNRNMGLYVFSVPEAFYYACLTA